jgi:hypothetical protein
LPYQFIYAAKIAERKGPVKDKKIPDCQPVSFLLAMSVHKDVERHAEQWSKRNANYPVNYPCSRTGAFSNKGKRQAN